MTEQEKINYIKEFSRGAAPSVVRKEIGNVWNLKKSARNAKYNKLFSEFEKSLLSPKAKITGFGMKASSPKLQVKGEKASVEVKDSPQIYTLEELIAASGINMDEWNVTKFTANSYGTNFQAKAEFTKKKEVALRQILEEFKEDSLNFAPNVDKIPRATSTTGKLLVLNIADAHIGKLANKEQCGHNYDLKIAKEIYINTVKDLVAKAQKQGGIDNIWYVVGNDYLTIDTPQNTTTRGTPQDVDTRFSKIFREGRKLLVETIEMLKQIAPIHIIVMPGNHDRASMFHLGDALECWYRNDQNVTVDNDDKLRKYYTNGEIAFNFTHGDGIKTERLVQSGLSEYGKEWGAAKRRFIIQGHYHHHVVQNVQGVELWTLPSFSGSDDYHQQNGYVGSTRQSLAMVFGKDNLDAVFYSQPVENKDYQ
jgi:hypothetical protein